MEAKASGAKRSLVRLFCLSTIFAALLVVIGTSGPIRAEAAQQNLAWDPPTTYNNVAPVIQPSGYKIYWGNASGKYQQSVDVGNRTSYTLTGLDDGATYFFAIAAYDAGGSESPFSRELTKSFASLPPSYVITATYGSGGSISALNNSSVGQASSGTTTVTSVTVAQGASQSFSIAPATGYRIAGLTVDGAALTASTSYTFSNVTANHTLSATFVPNSYTITATAGTGGSISPAGPSSVAAGGSKSFTITPANGYKIAGLKVDGVTVALSSSYSFSNVTANHSIAASFAVDSYTISASAGTGGSISPTGTSSIAAGGSKTFTITPASGYKIAGLKVDGVAVAPSSSYSFSNVTANHSIAASFAANAMTVSFNSTTPSSPAVAGAKVTFAAAASGGSGQYQYQFWLYNPVGATWTVAQPYGASSSWTWDTTGLPTANYSIQVWARNLGSSASYQAMKAATYSVSKYPPVSSLSVATTPSSPASAGTKVTFKALSSGGSGSYQYQFWLYNPVTRVWSVGQSYGGASSWIWDTTGLPPANYTIEVWTRNLDSTSSYQMRRSVSYQLAP